MELKPVDDMNVFQGSMKKINGKDVLVVKAKTETIVREDGTKDVIVHLPVLKMRPQNRS